VGISVYGRHAAGRSQPGSMADSSSRRGSRT
jgi:hypothetical protein